MKPLDNKIEDWKKLNKIRNQINSTQNKQRKLDLIRTFSHQSDLYKQKYQELYSPMTYFSGDNLLAD